MFDRVVGPTRLKRNVDVAAAAVAMVTRNCPASHISSGRDAVVC